MNATDDYSHRRTAAVIVSVVGGLLYGRLIPIIEEMSSYSIRVLLLSIMFVGGYVILTQLSGRARLRPWPGSLIPIAVLLMLVAVWQLPLAPDQNGIALTCALLVAIISWHLTENPSSQQIGQFIVVFGCGFSLYEFIGRGHGGLMPAIASLAFPVMGLFLWLRSAA